LLLRVEPMQKFQPADFVPDSDDDAGVFVGRHRKGLLYRRSDTFQPNAHGHRVGQDEGECDDFFVRARRQGQGNEVAPLRLPTGRLHDKGCVNGRTVVLDGDAQGQATVGRHRRPEDGADIHLHGRPLRPRKRHGEQ
jgi:hypothetical protein